MENTLGAITTKQNRGRLADSLIDTSFVLFFLAIDMGQNLGRIGFDTVFIAMSLGGVAVLPYFVATPQDTNFGRWILGRGMIVAFALLLGVIFNYSLGVVIPEALSFLPFTLLIMTAMLSCFIQFYNFYNFRLSK